MVRPQDSARAHSSTISASRSETCGLDGAWRSLVAHLPWAQGVGGSNPLAPIRRTFAKDSRQ